MKEKPKGFIMYFDAMALLDTLSNAECGRVIRAISAYGRTGEEPPLKLTKAAYMTYLFMKAQLERDLAKYDATVKRNRINGAKGGKTTQKRKSMKMASACACEPLSSECQTSQANTKTSTSNNTSISTNTNTGINTGTSQGEDPGTEAYAAVGRDVSSAPTQAAPGEIDTHAQKKPYGSYGNVFLTDEEYARLVAEHPEDHEKAIAHLDEYIKGSGKRPSDHYYALTSWVFTALRERAVKEEELALREKRIAEQKQTASDYSNKLGEDRATGRLEFNLEDFFEKPV